jgi:hypothetical protein
MNMTYSAEKTQKSEPRNGAPVTQTEFEDWLAECESLATRAGFRGLLEIYFAKQPYEQYPGLAIGAKEIMDGVVSGILSEGQPEDLCTESRLRDLVYPKGQKGCVATW